jgi:hypothetical protein
MRRSIAHLAAAALLAETLAGCAGGPTPYQPLAAHSPIAGGYSDTRLAADRYTVTFAGNSFTSRETVESYLLFRAAELTVAQGYDWFAVVDHETDHRITREIVRDPPSSPWYADRYGAWRPYWRYQLGAGIGWRDWDPYHGDLFWTTDVDMRTLEEFEATAEIRLGRGSIPAGADHAYEARTVIADLATHVRYPEPADAH